MAAPSDGPVLRPRSRAQRDPAASAGAGALTAADATSLAGIAKALADPTRLRLFATLRAVSPTALTQVELVEHFDLSQPAIAKHLRILLDARVIDARRQGAWMHYFVPADDATSDLERWLARGR